MVRSRKKKGRHVGNMRLKKTWIGNPKGSGHEWGRATRKVKMGHKKDIVGGGTGQIEVRMAIFNQSTERSIEKKRPTGRILH